MESIHDSFEKCNRLFIEATQSSHDESFIKDAIVTLGSCLQRVEAADLYSKGEELEEYSTQSLKVRHLCWRVIFAILANSTRIGCILFNTVILVGPIAMNDCFSIILPLCTFVALFSGLRLLRTLKTYIRSLKRYLSTSVWLQKQLHA